jgi:hypothetical protein
MGFWIIKTPFWKPAAVYGAGGKKAPSGGAFLAGTLKPVAGKALACASLYIPFATD